jgi:hypothetical protein
MPVPAVKRLLAPDALPSSEIEVDTDCLSPIGIRRGSTIEYFEFEERFKERFFHIRIKRTDEEAVTRICFTCQPVKVMHEGVHLSLEDIDILGVFVEKPKLRLLK